MFDLEQSIIEWRRQMLAAGIKTPVPLEELESHLREEIERQIQTGVTEQQAFELATAQIGQAKPLKAEFKKTVGFLGWLGADKNARINRVLALLWLAYCSWGSLQIAALLSYTLYVPNFRPMPDFFFVLLIEVVLLCGLVGSILLFDGKTWGRWIIRVLAVLGVFTYVAQIFTFKTVSVPVVVFAVFNLASIWLLRPLKKAIRDAAGN